VPAQFIPLQIRDIRRRLYLHSVGVWTPTEKVIKIAFISPFLEVGIFCSCRFASAQKTSAE